MTMLLKKNRLICFCIHNSLRSLITALRIIVKIKFVHQGLKKTEFLNSDALTSTPSDIKITNYIH